MKTGSIWLAGIVLFGASAAVAAQAQVVHAMQIGALPDVRAQLSAGETSAAFQAAGFKNSGGRWRSDDCYDANGPGPCIEQAADLTATAGPRAWSSMRAANVMAGPGRAIGW